MDWWDVSVRVPARLADRTATLLTPIGDGAAAIDFPFTQRNLEDDPERVPEAPAVVRVDVMDTGGARQREALRRHARRLLRPLDVPFRLRVRKVGEHDWAEAWKAHFPVLHVGKRLVVRPIWRPYRAQPGETVIDLNPGIAFGTGDHPTTHACLEAAERHIRQGMRVLDLGSGSGILSVAAAKLGAATVWALDIDPFALDATRANVERNGLSDQVKVRQGSLGANAPADLPATFDLVLANIASGPLIELAPALAGALAEGGVVVASGIIAERLQGVREAFAAQGLIIDDTVEDGEWRTLVARR